MIRIHFPTQFSGIKAENIACQFLQNHGLKLIKRNYRTRYGEIDLIMENQDYLIFIEVRYRQSNRHANSVESIDKRKQLKIIRSATAYLQKYPSWKKCRIDVVAIQSSGVDDEIMWIKNAFQVQ